MKNSYLSEVTKVDWAERLVILFSTVAKPVKELFYGITKKVAPLHVLLPISFSLQLVLMLGLDKKILSIFHLQFFYPQRAAMFCTYYFIVVSSPFWFWAWSQAIKKERLSRVLKETLECIGLKNNLGNLPHFIYDKPLDSTTRKLKLSKAALSLSDFNKAKEGIESGLQIFIDEIREDRTRGTVDIIYSNKPMPETCRVADYQKLKSPSFVVGATRAKEIKSNLDRIPHLLVAGQTGAGKSTFLRQFVTTLYLNDPNCTFTLVDLKAGLDSQLFERLPRISIPNNMKDANYTLGRMSYTVDYRTTVLKSQKCRDITEFNKLPKEKRALPQPENPLVIPGLNRHIIIVDEAAEMFLAGEKTKASEAQEARRVLSKIARQGRSLGIHLVVATQRPDSRALDPQIKANLTGVLCFQMVNDISSILVLGNGRATDLPPVPGRAIWKAGMEIVEVQTPLLEWEEVQELLKDEYVDVAIPKMSQTENTVVPSKKLTTR